MIQNTIYNLKSNCWCRWEWVLLRDTNNSTLSKMLYLKDQLLLIYNPGIENWRWKCCFKPSDHRLFTSISNDAWVTSSQMVHRSTYTGCFGCYWNSGELRGTGVIPWEKLVWNILLFMSVHVHVSAPGNVKYKATPESQSNYGHTDTLFL